MGRVEELEAALVKAFPNGRPHLRASGSTGISIMIPPTRGFMEWHCDEPEFALIVAAVNELPDLIKLAKAAEDCLRYRPGTRRHKDAEETMRIALARLDGDWK